MKRQSVFRWFVCKELRQNSPVINTLPKQHVYYLFIPSFLELKTLKSSSSRFILKVTTPTLYNILLTAAPNRSLHKQSVWLCKNKTVFQIELDLYSLLVLNRLTSRVLLIASPS